MIDIAQLLAQEFSFKTGQVKNALALKEEGNTIPFIARYRKERTGGLTDEELRALFKREDYFTKLEERKSEVRQGIDEQGKMTPELSQAIDEAVILSRLEDIYRPYKKKRNTKGELARKRGLLPLKEALFREEPLHPEKFIDEKKEVFSSEEAIEGALHILAEEMADVDVIREAARKSGYEKGIIKSQVKKGQEEQKLYEMYFDYEEPVKKIKNHRVLALLRGEREEVLRVKIEFDEGYILRLIEEYHGVRGKNHKELIREGLADGVKRLLLPSIENELLSHLREVSEAGAIDVMKANLRELLLRPPVKDQVILGFDPGFRTGCKLAVVDNYGNLLGTEVIYPVPPHNKVGESKEKIRELIRLYGVTGIALGNGTASRESEAFLVDVLKDTPDVAYTIVSEAGASVYSASPTAVEEFPELDVTLRSAVSIARRVIDPLAELVKIPPESIGVGQYQHDLKGKDLKEALSGVVEACVNFVGVDVNTASKELLTYIAGLSKTTSENILRYRLEKGAFKNREGLKKVKGIGDKVFTQCAGFLRIKEGNEPLDNTGIHPESYHLARMIMAGEEDFPAGSEATVADIKKELAQPGREVRDDLEPVIFKRDILNLEDLKEGQVMTGIVRNVVDFGVFVDLGVHEDGLVHISQLSDNYVKHPLDVVSIGETIKVRILEVDLDRKRIALSAKGVEHGG